MYQGRVNAGGKMHEIKRSVIRMRHYLYFMIPAVIWYLVFQYYPMYGIVIAFKNYRFVDGIVGSQWVGLDNFVRLLSSPSFREVLRNTFVISLAKIIFSFPAPILLALLLNEVMNIRFKKLVQSISYLPHFISWVILGGMIKVMLSPSTGIINRIIGFFGGEPIFFLGSPSWFVPVLIITDIWQSVGWGTVVYLATISSIDTQIYECAKVEGANRFKQAIYITLPSLLPIISILLIMRMGHILNAGFDQVFNLYNPMVYSVGDVLSTFVYRTGLEQMQYSFSTAVGLFKNVIGLILVLISNYAAKSISGYGIW